HAPEEERDARDRCGWRRRRVIARASERRIQTLETTEPRRQSIAQPGRAQQAAQAGAFIKREHRGDAFQPRWIGHEAEQRAARQRLRTRAPRRAPALVRDACVLDERAVPDTRRARRLAPATSQAAAGMADRVCGGGETTRRELLHEMNAAARRLSLQPRHEVRRTCLQADAAVDAGAAGLDIERERRDGHADYVTGIRPGAST